MKTQVYSWLVPAEIKADLEREAKRRNVSLASILELAAREWLNRSSSDISDDQAQTRLHKVTWRYVGAFEGSDPNRSQNIRQTVRERLRRCNHY